MRFFCTVLFFLLMSSTTATALTYLEDHFGDGTLQQWTVSIDPVVANATYYVEDSNLIISDIDDSNPSINMGGYIYFTNTLAIPLAGDFHADFIFSWDEFNDIAARQYLNFTLLSDNGDIITRISFKDRFHAFVGRMENYIGNFSYTYLGPFTLPYAGNANVDIDRAGDLITIMWNGGIVLTGIDSKSISVVEISAWHSEWTYGPIPSFGEFRIDYVNLQGGDDAIAIPEPLTILTSVCSVVILAIKRFIICNKNNL
ncbi:MAG: hypothetical protein AB1454_09080 [Candidatus Auribacterota bacterium]